MDSRKAGGKGSGGKGLRIMESEWLDGVNRGSMRACGNAWGMKF